MRKLMLSVATLALILTCVTPALAQEEPEIVNGVPAPKVVPRIDEVSTPGPVYRTPGPHPSGSSGEGPSPKASGGSKTGSGGAKL